MSIATMTPMPVRRTDESTAFLTAQRSAAARLDSLTERQRDVLKGICDGLPNKTIAATLNISQRTVEAHRAQVMKRTGSASLPDLVRLVMHAG